MPPIHFGICCRGSGGGPRRGGGGGSGRRRHFIYFDSVCMPIFPSPFPTHMPPPHHLPASRLPALPSLPISAFPSCCLLLPAMPALYTCHQGETDMPSSSHFGLGGHSTFFFMFWGQWQCGVTVKNMHRSCMVCGEQDNKTDKTGTDRGMGGAEQTGIHASFPPTFRKGFRRLPAKEEKDDGRKGVTPEG